MANPITQNMMMNRLAPVKNIMNLARAAKNPEMMFKQMASQNPQFKQAMDYISENGGDPQNAFYKLAKEKGVDPETIINYLK